MLPVPFYPQQPQNYNCAPAALRMVFAYHGIHRSEDELCTACGTVSKPLSFGERFRRRRRREHTEVGTTLDGMLRAATQHGFGVDICCDAIVAQRIPTLLRTAAPSVELLARDKVHVLNPAGGWKLLEEAYTEKLPVIAMLRFAPDRQEPNHALVVRKVSRDRVDYLDPAETTDSMLFFNRAAFISQWELCGLVALVLRR